MKIHKIGFLMLSTLFLFSLSATDLLAQDGEANEERQRRGRKHEMTDKKHRGAKERMSIPGLTDEQKASMKTIRTNAKKESLPLKNELNEKRARLKTLTSATTANIKDINKVADEIGALRTQLMKQHLATHQKVRSILTEDQRIHFDSKPQRRKGRRHGK